MKRLWSETKWVLLVAQPLFILQTPPLVYLEQLFDHHVEPPAYACMLALVTPSFTLYHPIVWILTGRSRMKVTGSSSRHALNTGLVIVLFQAVSSVQAQNASGCVTRACLVSTLLASTNQYVIPSEREGCKVEVKITNISIETLEVDTKNLYFVTILRMTMVSIYEEKSWYHDYCNAYEAGLHHCNQDQIHMGTKAVATVCEKWKITVKPTLKMEKQSETSHLLVYSNGTVMYNYLLWVTVGCDVNLYKYPFASDFCAIFLTGWTEDGCGVELDIMNASITVMGKDRGNWVSESAEMEGKDGHTILKVNIRSQIYKVLVSLIIPSIMIILADVVGFALPILDGERVSYKVTLVLGFVMFLLILTDILPGSPKCVPLLSQHFTITLIFLLLSLIETVLVTYLAAAGTPSLCPPWKKGREAKQHPEKGAGERQHDKGQNGVAPELLSDTVSPGLGAKPLQRIIRFISYMEDQEQDAEKKKSFAAKVDKVCFTLYMLVLMIYSAVMLYMFLGNQCSVNHLIF
ncbi:5-hydroxytryptamine receptor 3A [Acipenser ruthenus]|uniref:5-hydroxytryptamine receptor 3A n=1 Tax=Acipenser ruthenus TaxID=7906 RepID=A0A662YZQ0_ACIRT|nr:5-hydroxytryptamine receptor 3A [Acipenser ruthenus]